MEERALEVPQSGYWYLSWWVAWVLTCVLRSGALAVLVEFNWGGIPYGGGFPGIWSC